MHTEFWWNSQFYKCSAGIAQYPGIRVPGIETDTRVPVPSTSQEDGLTDTELRLPDSGDGLWFPWSIGSRILGDSDMGPAVPSAKTGVHRTGPSK